MEAKSNRGQQYLHLRDKIIKKSKTTQCSQSFRKLSNSKKRSKLAILTGIPDQFCWIRPRWRNRRIVEVQASDQAPQIQGQMGLLSWERDRQISSSNTRKKQGNTHHVFHSLKRCPPRQVKRCDIWKNCLQRPPTKS